MEPELIEVLREAFETKQRKEELDRSIGRALRRRDMGFEAYVKITSGLRELACGKGMSLDDAAREILAHHQKDAD
jgi:hypothetical protein